MSAVCKTEPGQTEPTGALPDPAYGGRRIKEENVFMVKEEEEIGLMVKEEEEIDFMVKEEEDKKISKEEAEAVRESLLPSEWLTPSVVS